MLLWPKRLFFVDSKGNVREFFGLRFWPFSARVQMVFGPFRICSCRRRSQVSCLGELYLSVSFFIARWRIWFFKQTAKALNFM